MHSHGQFLWHLLSALALTSTIATAQQPVTKSYCTTSFDTKSTNLVKSKTDYSTRTEKPTIYVTSTPSITTTPPPSTQTLIVATMTTITVTASQITDTFTDTSTILTTTTIEAPTFTYTETVKETTDTTVTGTSIVPAPAGFTPIQISAKRPAKRDLAHSFPNNGGLVARANERRAGGNSGSGNGKSPVQYPKKVECKVQVTSYAPAKTSVKTAKTTATIAAAAQTYTVTETTTYEATSTYLPTPASTTVSTSTIVVVEETFTPSTTVTTTETVTNTINAPQVTEYAQCQQDNFIGVLFQAGLPLDTFVSGYNTAYECCVACALQPGCEFSAFFPNPFCILVGNSQQTCSDTFSVDLSSSRYIGSNGCRNANYLSG